MSKLTVNKGFLTQKIKGKTTLYSAEDSTMLTLNETASFIFNNLKIGLEEDKIITKLVEVYGVTPEQADADINTLISELKKKKVLLPSHSSKA